MSIRKCIVLISSSSMTSILCSLVFTKPSPATKPVKEEHPGVAGDGSSSASANEKVNQEDLLGTVFFSGQFASLFPPPHTLFFAFESALTLDNDLDKSLDLSEVVKA